MRAQERKAAAEQRREELRLRRAGLTASMALGTFALAPAAAQAADFEVNTLGDPAPDASPGACTTAVNGCTLREALNDGNSNGQPDEITFQSGLSGTITLQQGQLQVGAPADYNEITIHGGGVITVSGDQDSSGTPTAGDTRILNATADLTLTGLTMTRGVAAGAGGAINVAGSSASLTLLDDTITNSTADRGGGLYSQGEVEAANTVITNNTAAFSGGGISHDEKYAPLHLSNSVISNNTSPRGGGIHVFADSGPSQGAPHSEILNTTISGNHTPFLGAGIHLVRLNPGGRFEISHSTISGNTGEVASFGGGIDVTGPLYGDLSVSDSTIAGNSAGSGAGVSVGDGYQVQVVDGDGSLEFANSTIAGNAAAVSGGGFYLGSYSFDSGFGSPTVPLDSTIVANNTLASSANDLDGADNSLIGAFDLSFSLVEASGDAPVTQTPPGSSILGADPQLGGLANNGGPTLTMLIAPTSPAVDKGFAPARLTTDQRGAPRTVDVSVTNARDGTDIGAVEIAQGPPTPPASQPLPATAPKKKCKKKKKRSAESAKKKKCKKKRR